LDFEIWILIANGYLQGRSLGMTIIWDPIYLLNVVLCFIIMVVGYWGHKKTGDMLPYYIALAYGIFAISHFLSLLSIKGNLEYFLIAIRTIGYLIITFALSTLIFKPRKKG
jgi:hypothetical protein